MKALITLLALTLASSLTASETYLSPLDFGLSLMEHGMVDYCNTPPHILVGNYNNDSYPDIARFTGNKLEIFIFMGKGYTPEPQQSRTFQQPIKSLRHDGNLWDGIDNLVVTFADGSEKTFHHNRGGLNLNGTTGNPKRTEIPRRVSEADFEIVWESEPYTYGMHRCTVGDLDNDGINELVTWWKESYYDSSGWILIYKSVGDDEYELFMEEPFYTIETYHPYLTYLLIADLDQNGQNELIFTRLYTYFWEFSEPGVYTTWRSNFTFPRAVQDVRISDVDQDGILELAALTANSGQQPPTAYIVREFSYKSTEPENIITFSSVTGFYYDYMHQRFDVGDFDNDGAIDMVAGVFGWASGNPIDIRYFRYDPGSANNFSQNWLYTGVPATCAVPIIEDFDGDGNNELFVQGVVPTASSAFLYEGTGFGVGSVTWMDTTSMALAPYECCFGYVDSHPSVLSFGLAASPTPYGVLWLWSYQNDTFVYAWDSGHLDTVGYQNPHLFDIDSDNKTNILLVDDFWDKAVDWEQTSTGIWGRNSPESLGSFQLNSVYPNPFNSFMDISFQLMGENDVQINVFNIIGEELYNCQEENLKPGQYRVSFNTGGWSSGLYFIALESGTKTQVRKAVLLK